MKKLILPIILLLFLAPVVAGAAWSWTITHPGSGENLPTGGPYRFEVSCDPTVTSVQVYIPTYLQPPIFLSKDPYIPGMWTGLGTVQTVSTSTAVQLYIILSGNNTSETHGQGVLLVPPVAPTTTVPTTTIVTTAATTTVQTVQTLSAIPTPTPPPTAAPGDTLVISAPDSLWVNNQFEVSVSHIIYNGQLKWSILDQNNLVADENSGTQTIRMSEDSWSDTIIVDLNTNMDRLEPGFYHIYIKINYLAGKLGPRIQSTGSGTGGSVGGFSYAEYTGQPMSWGNDAQTPIPTSTVPVVVPAVTTSPPPAGIDGGILVALIGIFAAVIVLGWYAYTHDLFKRQTTESPVAVVRPTGGRRLE